jgi:enoyl-CoA hydratase/carnithine racemase
MNYNYDHLDINVAERVATVTFKRPEYFSYEAHHEVEEIWTDLAADHEVNAIILTGAGDVFLNPKTMGMEKTPKPGRRNHGRHQTSNGRAWWRIFSMSNSRLSARLTAMLSHSARRWR